MGITLATLWRWEKSGYLIPVRIGTKVFYRKSDIASLTTNQDEKNDQASSLTEGAGFPSKATNKTSKRAEGGRIYGEY